jgi:hypothetical protein
MRLLLSLLSLSLLLSSCASKKKPQPTGQATLIGMIEMVNPEQNYVLIRCDQPFNIKPGTELTALGSDGKKAKLMLTPERKGHYLTADIKEGQPLVSNLVLIPNGSLPAATPAATPAAPAPAPVTPPPTSPSTLTLPTLPDIPLDLPLPTTERPTSVPTAPLPATPEPAPNLGDLEPPVKGS